MAGWRREVYTGLLVRKPDGKGKLGRPKRRWVVKIKIDLQEIGLIWLWRGTGGGPCE
jgi:hypothetical protein